MRAWVLETFGGPLVRRERPRPVPGPGEVLVRVSHVGVCGTDLKIRAGAMGLDVVPLVMGHEVAGVVAELGPGVQGLAPGDRVTVNFYVTCGRCGFCRAGRETLCLEVRQHGFSIDGGFAEYMRTPAVNCCPVPAHVPLEQACILADAVATAYHAVTRRGRVQPGRRVAVVGVGGVGLHVLQMARLAGGWVAAVDRSPAALERARAHGADAVVDAREGPFHEPLRRLTGGEGADVVFELVGSAETLPSSYRSLRRAGRLVFVGYRPGVSLPVLPHELVRNEWEIVGSRANTTQELRETMELVARGRIQPVVERIWSFDELEAAFAALGEGRAAGRQVVAV